MKKAIIIFVVATLCLAFLCLVEPITKSMEVYDAVTGGYAARGETLTSTSRKVEASVISAHESASPISKILGGNEAKVASLGEVDVSDFVLDTYYPMGEATSEFLKDEYDRFREITVETPGKEWWDIHPSEEDTAAYRNQLISEWEAAKEAAWYASLPTDTPTPTAGPTPKPTKTPGPVPAPDVPIVAPAPAPPELTPSPAPTKAPTVTPAVTTPPTPEPPDFSLTPEELAEVEKQVEQWYQENSYVEERDTIHSVTFSGEKIRSYVNSYHPEWQVAYIMSLMVEYFHDSNPSGDETQISRDIEEMVCRQLTSGYDFNLMIDYWSADWGDKWAAGARTLSLEEGDLCTSYHDPKAGVDVPLELFDRIENDYTEKRREDEPDLIKEEWIEPFVMFRNIYAWSENLSFGDRIGGTNEFGFYEQEVVSKKVGSIFLEIVSIYDFPNSELLLMRDALKELPEAALAVSRWYYAIGELDSSGGYLVDNGTITWLGGTEIGEQIARLALQQVGAKYSNELRYQPGYFDCSSLTHYLYQSVGVNVAWNGSDVAADQCQWCDKTYKTLCNYYNESEMIPGDLIFWETRDTGHVSYSRYKHVYHVGVYIGNGIIVDASSSCGQVVCREMWGKEKVVGIARPYR